MDTQHTNLYTSALAKAFSHANDFLHHLDTDPVDVELDYEAMKSLWDWQLPMQGTSPDKVIDELNASARPGLVHNQSGRFFSFVIGGSHPSSIAADWLTSAWDQNSGLYVATPAASIVEEIAGQWLKEIFGLPKHTSFAFVTGGQMANFTCLNAARNHVFNLVNWDIEKMGFYGAPHVRIIAGDQKHSTIVRALRLLGFGSERLIQIPSNPDSTINTELVIKELERDPDIPTILMLQAGDIHTGGFDDFKTIIPVAHQHKAWVHIDGAFGLWAQASAKYRHLMEGASLADSWCVDGHKWLNVPYDCGYAFIAQPDAHYLSLNQSAAYLSEDARARDQMHWTPELSRRARGFATWAAIKELGTSGIEELVDRLCAHAKAIIGGIADHPQVEVLTYPIINQGMVRFHHIPGSTDTIRDDHFTDEVIHRINRSGEAFVQPSTFKGKHGMRISVSGWRTSESDVKRMIDVINHSLNLLSRSE